MIPILPGNKPVFQVIPAAPVKPTKGGAETASGTAKIESSDPANVAVELLKGDASGLTFTLSFPEKAKPFTDVKAKIAWTHGDLSVVGTLTRTGIDEDLQGGVFKQIA
jgi:hypothetical protein